MTDDHGRLRVPRETYSRRLDNLAATDHTQTVIYAYLCTADAASEPLNAHEVAQHLDYSFTTAQAALKALARRGYIEQTGVEHDYAYMKYYVGGCAQVIDGS